MLAGFGLQLHSPWPDNTHRPRPRRSRPAGMKQMKQMPPTIRTSARRPAMERHTLHRNFRGLLQQFHPDPKPGPIEPMQEPPHEVPPVREPDMPRPTPLPGAPSITPHEFPKHPGEPPMPGRHHPSDPNPPQPVDQWSIQVLRALWRNGKAQVSSNKSQIASVNEWLHRKC